MLALIYSAGLRMHEAQKLERIDIDTEHMKFQIIINKKIKYSMRQNFVQQYKIGVEPISKVKITLKSRDGLPSVLTALQYIFITPELNKKVFKILIA